jgi:hypothetical protein
MLFAADRTPSKATDHTRVIKAAELMRVKPFSPEARKEGEWALNWIADTPDVNVTLCGSLSPGYKYERYVMASYVLSMGAFILKNPKKAPDQNAVWRAGVDGMLDTYQEIIRKRPNEYDAYYDDLLNQRREDGLVSFMHEFGLHCYASGSWSRV